MKQHILFEIGAASERQFPEADLPEVAFAGRSNVGKSSLLNTLTSRKQLARVSGTPGKTQEINFFRIADDLRFVDLPGYGFAKVSKKQREQWGRLIDGYFRSDRPLVLALLLIDSRHKLQDLDAEVLVWMIEAELPVQIVLTKIDKLKQGERTRQLRILREAVSDLGYPGDLLPFSSVRGFGKKELLTIISEAAQVRLL